VNKDAHASLARWLSSQVKLELRSLPEAVVQDGKFHQCVLWRTTRDVPFFVKLGRAAREDAFAAEAAGLRELAQAQALRVPAVHAVGVHGTQAVLALEWLPLETGRDRDAGFQSRLGEALATQHRTLSSQHGWHRDNTIGATPQHNEQDDDWVRFFVRRRLEPQLDLGLRNGLESAVIDRGRRLCGLCGAFFSSYRPVASLLHGDLWSGNYGRHLDTGEPVVFDPSVYYGDRETDIAMTRLFGGFGPAFYAAYQAAWPLDQAAGTRCTLYNLYHVLNHYNLFGGGYGRQAADMIERLLAELG
jgi:fructosamine-3-kinase